MGVADYSKRQLKTVRFPIWRALIQTASKWLRSLAATYKHYCTMLATATGNCDVTNVTYNENKYYVVTWIVYLESFMYLRQRQWLRHMVVVCHITEVIDLPNMVLMKHWAHCKSMTQPPHQIRLCPLLVTGGCFLQTAALHLLYSSGLPWWVGVQKWLKTTGLR